jgi:hypothetical protein
MAALYAVVLLAFLLILVGRKTWSTVIGVSTSPLHLFAKQTARPLTYDPGIRLSTLRKGAGSTPP